MSDRFEKIRHDLKDQVLNNLDFRIQNMQLKDILISKYLYTENKKKGEIKFEDLTKEIIIFFSKIQSKTNKICIMDTVIKSSPVEDELIVDTIFKYKKYYLSPMFHQFLNKPNSLSLKGNLSLLNLRFPIYYRVPNPPHIDPIFKPTNTPYEDELSLGVDYKHEGNKIGFFLQNVFFFPNDTELLTKYKYSISKEDIKRNKDQRTFKCRLMINLYERPFVFRENLIFDPINKINLQYSHKIIENNFDDLNSSLEMKTNLPQEDSLHQLKFSLTSCNFSNYRNFMENYQTFLANNNANNSSSVYFKISSSFNKSINNTFLENKIFFRKLMNIKNIFIYQLNLEGAHILSENFRNLKMHENILIKNFKGIYNPGDKIIVEEGKTGDSIGNNYFLAWKNKLIYNNVPLLNNYTLNKDNFEIAPFIYLNFLICGNTSLDRLRDYTPYHYSTGFGLNILTDAFNMEFYYNLSTKKNKFDVGSEFGLNIGLD